MLQSTSAFFPYTTLFRSPLIGHVMLDMLEESGFGPDDDDAVGGLTMGADPVGTAILHAAASRGLNLDALDRKSTRLNSSHVAISYAVCCLKKKRNIIYYI